MITYHASELPYQAEPGIYPLSEVMIQCNDAKKIESAKNARLISLEYNRIRRACRRAV